MIDQPLSLLRGHHAVRESPIVLHDFGVFAVKPAKQIWVPRR
jgi:hypothetical protein